MNDSLKKIDVQSNLGLSDFEKKYYDLCLPVVISDATIDWAAHKKWSINYFKEKFGKTVVKINGESANFSDFLSLVEKSTPESPSPYLHGLDINELFPDMLQDLMPSFIYTRHDRLKSKLIPAKFGMRNGVIELLIGAKGACFPVLHFDGYHQQTFITQIRGDKEFYMIPPDQTRFLYVEDEYTNQSPVNFFAPDYKKFPLFKNAESLMVLVKEGQTLYVPSGWWHTTKIVSDSIAVSVNSINGVMWNRFVNDFAHLHFKNSVIRRSVFKSYMSFAGNIMNITGNK